MEDRRGAWFETGLCAVVFVLPPLLAVAARGVAALAAAAGLFAAGLVLARAPMRLGALRAPAIVLGLLVLWGALSAAWSIDSGRSLILAARLLGLAFAALALAAAADRVARPERIALCLLAGTGLGIALAAIDLASGGAVHRLAHIRAYVPTGLNQIAAALAILALPTGAALYRRGRVALAALAAAPMVVAVALLVDSTAKLGLAVGVPVAALVCWRRRAATCALAALTVLAIVAAPLALPRLALVPGLLEHAQAFKGSAEHRLLIWSFVGARIAEHPALGWGLDASRAIPGGKTEVVPGGAALPLHPHDAALQVWLELGAPGAALFALLAALLWRRLGETDWPPLYAGAAGGGFVAALAIASASYGIWQEWWLGTLALTVFLMLVMGRMARPP